MKKGLIRAFCLGLWLMAGSARAAFDFRAQIFPDLVVGGWFNLDDPKNKPSLGALKGKVVVIGTWQTTCNACLGGLARLREIHDKYASQGVTVLLLSPQNKPTIENQTPKHAVKFPSAHDSKVDLGIELTGSDKHDPDWHAADNPGRPEVFLLAVDGAVVWQGDASELSHELIEEETARALALPPREWGKGVASFVKDIERRKYGKAYVALAKLAAKGDEDSAEAQLLLDHVALLAARRKELADKYVSFGRYLRAFETLEEISNQFEGTDWAEEADAQVKNWKKDKEIKKSLEAEHAFLEGKRLLQARKYQDARNAFIEAAKKAPDGPLGAEAKKEVEAIDRRFDKSKGP